MFEKEAEEWVKENMDCCKTDNSVNQSIPYFDEEERCCAKSAFKDGAEFGYNKAFVEADKNLKAVVADFNKANEWHYVKDGDLPPEDTRVFALMVGGEVCIAHFYRKNVWDKIGTVYAWKEIVPPNIKEM